MEDKERGKRIKKINRLGHLDVAAVIIFTEVQNWIGKVAAYFLGRRRAGKGKPMQIYHKETVEGHEFQG